ncbi:XRE family transcriptional regulator [Siphonobacter aquaeclarae]|jgi:transcriptional regulator with XRE-family HTH domain|uniref:Helix-turn-helix n=1 Tax=Siphonobacter aquaeclarae TaxID=563176 RepID=A0A1G9L3E3_9BACT|nr:LexA family transcriptional regulator [Siphonobacter aquaeclarae]MBO9640540.1 LexA family transcriptional regulator [Siphonobacter aquaeclarae]SDL56451.1 Helix-turn-helix [Siphonobacter aquaeclarae]
MDKNTTEESNHNGFFSRNLVYLRGRLEGRISQQRLADELGLKKSTWAAYESARAEPKYGDLVKVADFFQVTVDELLRKDLSREPVQLPKVPELRVLATTVDVRNRDNVEFVPVKAMGGYAEGFGDLEYIGQLPAFNLPFLARDRKYRAFPYEGESMPPLKEGAVVFGEYIENWEGVKNGTICLVVTLDEGVVLKKVFNYLVEKDVLVLKSLNERFAPYPVRREDIKELWKFAGYFEADFPS